MLTAIEIATEGRDLECSQHGPIKYITVLKRLVTFYVNLFQTNQPSNWDGSF